MKPHYGKRKKRNKKLRRETKTDMEFDPTLKQPILNQIYNSWDIHGDERGIGGEGKQL